MSRRLGVGEFVKELHQRGAVDDFPEVKMGICVRPICVLQKNEKYFIAGTTSDGVHFLPRGDRTYKPDIRRRSFSSRFYVACFPTNHEHARILGNSVVRDMGPQERFPGAAVAVCGDLENGNDRFTIRYIQYCFKQGTPRKLSRSLASKYIGARNHLLEYLFNLDLLQNLGEIVTKHIEHRPSSMKSLEQALQKTKYKDFVHYHDYFAEELVKR